jgi:hypothetical protein
MSRTARFWHYRVAERDAKRFFEGLTDRAFFELRRADFTAEAQDNFDKSYAERLLSAAGTHGPRPESLVWLVHGTFADQDAWFGADSAFAERLRSCLPGALLWPFLWNGRNSQGARSLAAKEFVQRIKIAQLIFPEVPQFAVGHSHGGNILLYAVNRSKEAAAALQGIVCVATPFLRYEPRDHWSVIQVLPWLVSPVVAVLAALVCLFLALMASVGFRESSPSDLAARNAITFFVMTAAFLGFCWRQFAHWRRQAGRVDGMAHNRVLRILEAYALTDSVAVLCIRAAGDEVQSWLGLLNRITDIPFRVWFPKAYITLATGATILFGLAAVAMDLFDWGPNGFLAELAVARPGNENNLAFLFGSVAGPVVVPAAALSIVCGLSLLAMSMANWVKGSPIGYGRLSLLDHLLLRIRTTETPPSFSNVKDEVYNCTPPLRHCSILENPDVTRDIAAWIAKRSKVKAGLLPDSE